MTTVDTEPVLDEELIQYVLSIHEVKESLVNGLCVKCDSLLKHYFRNKNNNDNNKISLAIIVRWALSFLTTADYSTKKHFAFQALIYTIRNEWRTNSNHINQTERNLIINAVPNLIGRFFAGDNDALTRYDDELTVVTFELLKKEWPLGWEMDLFALADVDFPHQTRLVFRLYLRLLETVLTSKTAGHCKWTTNSLATVDTAINRLRNDMRRALTYVQTIVTRYYPLLNDSDSDSGSDSESKSKSIVIINDVIRISLTIVGRTLDLFGVHIVKSHMMPLFNILLTVLTDERFYVKSIDCLIGAINASKIDSFAAKLLIKNLLKKLLNRLYTMSFVVSRDNNSNNNNNNSNDNNNTITNGGKDKIRTTIEISPILNTVSELLLSISEVLYGLSPNVIDGTYRSDDDLNDLRRYVDLSITLYENDSYVAIGNTIAVWKNLFRNRGLRRLKPIADYKIYWIDRMTADDRLLLRISYNYNSNSNNNNNNNNDDYLEKLTNVVRNQFTSERVYSEFYEQYRLNYAAVFKSIITTSLLKTDEDGDDDYANVSTIINERIKDEIERVNPSDGNKIAGRLHWRRLIGLLRFVSDAWPDRHFPTEFVDYWFASFKSILTKQSSVQDDDDDEGVTTTMSNLLICYGALTGLALSRPTSDERTKIYLADTLECVRFCREFANNYDDNRRRRRINDCPVVALRLRAVNLIVDLSLTYSDRMYDLFFDTIAYQYERFSSSINVDKFDSLFWLQSLMFMSSCIDDLNNSDNSNNNNNNNNNSNNNNKSLSIQTVVVNTILTDVRIKRFWTRIIGERLSTSDFTDYFGLNDDGRNDRIDIDENRLNLLYNVELLRVTLRCSSYRSIASGYGDDGNRNFVNSFNNISLNDDNRNNHYNRTYYVEKLIPLLPHVFSLIRRLTSLWSRDMLVNTSTVYKNFLKFTEYDEIVSSSSKFNDYLFYYRYCRFNRNRNNNNDEKNYYLRNYVAVLYDKLLQTIALICHVLSYDFFWSDNCKDVRDDWLRTVLNGLDGLPDYRLTRLMRYPIKFCLIHCPPSKYGYLLRSIFDRLTVHVNERLKIRQSYLLTKDDVKADAVVTANNHNNNNNNNNCLENRIIVDLITNYTSLLRVMFRITGRDSSCSNYYDYRNRRSYYRGEIVEMCPSYIRLLDEQTFTGINNNNNDNNDDNNNNDDNRLNIYPLNGPALFLLIDGCFGGRAFGRSITEFYTKLPAYLKPNTNDLWLSVSILMRVNNISPFSFLKYPRAFSVDNASDSSTDNVDGATDRTQSDVFVFNKLSAGTFFSNLIQLFRKYASDDDRYRDNLIDVLSVTYSLLRPKFSYLYELLEEIVPDDIELRVYDEQVMADNWTNREKSTNLRQLIQPYIERRTRFKDVALKNEFEPDRKRCKTESQD